MDENQLTEQQKNYKRYFITSSVSFTAATILSFFFSKGILSIIMYKMFMELYSLIMIYTEYLHLGIAQRHKWSIHIFGINALGYFLYFISAAYYEHYNQGVLYVCAAFLVIIGTEFNIFVMFFHSQKNLWTTIKDEKYTVMRLLSQGIANSLFLISTLMQNQTYDGNLYSGVLNIMGGLASLLAMHFFILALHYADYKEFDTNSRVPSIG